MSENQDKPRSLFEMPPRPLCLCSTACPRQLTRKSGPSLAGTFRGQKRLGGPMGRFATGHTRLQAPLAPPPNPVLCHHNESRFVLGSEPSLALPVAAVSPNDPKRNSLGSRLERRKRCALGRPWNRAGLDSKGSKSPSLKRSRAPESHYFLNKCYVKMHRESDMALLGLRVTIQPS